MFLIIHLFIFLSLSFPSTTDQELLRQNLNSHFLNSQEREGRRSVPGAENNAAAAGRSTPGGPSASNSGPGSSGRTSQNQPSIPPLAFQFHQHNHQHQHTHTHQHFTPFLHPTATAPPLVRCSLLFCWTSVSYFKFQCSWNVDHVQFFFLDVLTHTLLLSFSLISMQAKWTDCTDTLWVLCVILLIMLVGISYRLVCYIIKQQGWEYILALVLGPETFETKLDWKCTQVHWFNWFRAVLWSLSYMYVRLCHCSSSHNTRRPQCRVSSLWFLPPGLSVPCKEHFSQRWGKKTLSTSLYYLFLGSD